MMILQDVPSIGLVDSSYTWDESWVLPYESIWSMIHKFSALNMISLSECKKLFKLDEIHREVITELGGKLSLIKLTKILGMGSGLDKNLVHEIIHSSDRAWLLSPYLRSCHICFGHGYHSVFHQITVIKKCPIHQTELTITVCKSCGSGDRYDSLNTSAIQMSNSPYTCAKCGRKHWHPYDDIDTSPRRKLLVMTVEQTAKLDALHKWFVASAWIAPYGTDMKRWDCMAGMLSFPAPIGMMPHRKSIYRLRGHEIQILRGQIIGLKPPESLTCSGGRKTTHSVVQYGLTARIPEN